MYVRLVLLACCAALNVFVDKLSKTWPPEFGGDKLSGFEIARVSSGLVVMAADKDGVTEGILQGNIDMAFVGKDMVSELPVREAGPESSRDVFQG